MDKKHIFYEGLELVTSFVFYKDGVIVEQAPDILWLRDTDGDGCATPQEVMIRDADIAPQVASGCTLVGGRWTSHYDGRVVSDSSQLRIDFLVSRQEAWQSNAWRWDADTRHRFRNDLRDARVLLAVTAAAANAKAGREPTDWMPSNATFRCRYLGDTPKLPDKPYDYLSPVVGQIRQGVDLGFANLEGTLTNASTPKCSGGSACYTFRNPPSYARVFARVGYDVLNLANNHSHDFGAVGLRDTETAIRNAGMRYTGLPGQITYLTSNGIRVAYVGFAPYSSTNNMLDLTTAAQLIRKANANAAIVVVYMHAGAEGADADHVTGQEEHYVGEDRGNPRRFAHMAVDNGASIVIGSGPHVMRGMEFYRHRLIAYSLGNFANFHNFNTSGVLSHSAVLRVTLTKTGGFARARLVSVSLASDGHATAGGSSVSFVRSLSNSDFGSAAAKLSSSGAVTQP